jgi:4-hydroxy-3-methylbut-2-enyl diphosphate reductase
MKVYVAEEAGFCFGVRRALDLIDDLYETEQHIQICGQLVHNRTVLENLRARGIDYIDSPSGYTPGKKLVIRTHGIPKEEETQLKKDNVDYLDATCPLVKRLHKIAAKADSQTVKSRFVIAGDEKHPEIIAARSYRPGTEIIGSIEDAENFQCQPHEPVDVMAQTTFDADLFDAVVAVLHTKTQHLNVHRTICNATIVRQEAVKKMAPEVDAMIVIGGKNSSNTRKLYNIARERNANTFHVESVRELRRDIAVLVRQVGQCETIGITAGASTPPGDIQDIKTFFANFNSNTAKEIYHG